MFLVTGDGSAVSELAALCVKGKREHVAPILYAHVHERNRKMSEIGVSVITMPHTNVVHVHTELKKMDKLYRVSYFIEPFNQKDIYEWE